MTTLVLDESATSIQIAVADNTIARCLLVTIRYDSRV